MLTYLLVLALVSSAAAWSDDSSSKSTSTSNSGRLDWHHARDEADRMIKAAKAFNGNLDPANKLFAAKGKAIVKGHHTSSSSSSTSSSSSSSSSSSTSTSFSTSDKIHMAVEERLIEQAIANALQPKKKAGPIVRKKAYQARYEISKFDANAFETGPELEFGPTIITTRRNFFLRDSADCAWTTAGDYLDADNDGAPDIIETLVEFRDTNSPSEYMRELRNRATGIKNGFREVGTIDLINLIRLDGVFSQTNQLLSPCFSATSEDEFVFETLVGVAEGQQGVLTSIPTQTSNILLAGSTAFVDNYDEDSSPREDDKNLFWDEVAQDFVESAEIALWVNVIPNQVEPGQDTIARQGTVYFTECSQFNYFQ